MYQEKTCNSAHEQTPLSIDTVDSILWHWEVGRANDIPVPPCIQDTACVRDLFWPLLIELFFMPSGPSFSDLPVPFQAFREPDF